VVYAGKPGAFPSTDGQSRFFTDSDATLPRQPGQLTPGLGEVRLMRGASNRRLQAQRKQVLKCLPPRSANPWLWQASSWGKSGV
jgi:hypothetical protein